MDALLAIPIGVDAQLDQLVLDTQSLRSQVLLLDHATHATHRIDAVIAKVGITLDPLMKAYRIAVEASAPALALYQEVATLTTVLGKHDESGSRLQPALRRALERSQSLFDAAIAPVQERLRNAYGTDIADAKGELKGLLLRVQALPACRSYARPLRIDDSIELPHSARTA